MSKKNDRNLKRHWDQRDDTEEAKKRWTDLCEYWESRGYFDQEPVPKLIGPERGVAQGGLPGQGRRK